MLAGTAEGPDWESLWSVVSAQGGYFTRAQARAARYSPPLVEHHVSAGKFARVGRGIFRLVHYPASGDEDLIVTWLWSGQAGAFSHQTALLLLDLSDVLPSRQHLTVPTAWAKRRLRVPSGVVLHHADLRAADRAWHGPVPVTTPLRTILDCAQAHVPPELVRQATRKGLASRDELRAALLGAGIPWRTVA